MSYLRYMFVCLRIVVSNTYLYLQVFVGGFMSYLRYMFVCLRIVCVGHHNT
jgi:hypothetical protein